MGLDEQREADYERRLGERADSLERCYRRLAKLEAQLSTANGHNDAMRKDHLRTLGDLGRTRAALDLAALQRADLEAQLAELYAVINIDRSLNEHQGYVDICSDAMDALEKLPGVVGELEAIRADTALLDKLAALVKAKTQNVDIWLLYREDVDEWFITHGGEVVEGEGKTFRAAIDATKGKPCEKSRQTQS